MPAKNAASKSGRAARWAFCPCRIKVSTSVCTPSPGMRAATAVFTHIDMPRARCLKLANPRQFLRAITYTSILASNDAAGAVGCTASAVSLGVGKPRAHRPPSRHQIICALPTVRESCQLRLRKE
eukprot:5883281-Pleurochrysis_carterae.AAC.2